MATITCGHCEETGPDEGLSCDCCGDPLCGECLKPCDCGNTYCPEHLDPELHDCEDTHQSES